jgi:hypothetical protein
MDIKKNADLLRIPPKQRFAPIKTSIKMSGHIERLTPYLFRIFKGAKR